MTGSTGLTPTEALVFPGVRARARSGIPRAAGPLYMGDVAGALRPVARPHRSWTMLIVLAVPRPACVV